MPSFEEKLLAAAIFLALEAPLAVIAYRVTHRARPLMPPGIMLVLAVLLPDPSWGALLLLASLFTMFGQAIGARTRKTVADERRQLAAHGSSPWLGQSRRSSMALIVGGVAGMLAGMATDGGRDNTSVLAVFLFFGGSVMLGMGLFRRHTALVLYLGKRRAGWLEVIQISTAFLAYGLATAGEFSHDPALRFAFRLASFNFLTVWVPLVKAQERPLLPETPFA